MDARNLLMVLLLVLTSCTTAVEKPKKLIEKDKMIDILYDISLLEAIKSQNIKGGISSQKSNEFLFKKYQIDSLQWEENNKYYATDIEEYKKMYQEVKRRIEQETQKANGSATTDGTIPSNPDEPMVK
ncbi:DUF4296 domain-containing protein [Flavobacterium sp.]|uniref:DUF4296 domain-containing protein n=1 Tax=Flavobacterium sp. TaxID=239 RepID=UPI0025D2A238|nr:DUF4296 domain-containing protein [Flavobacterium sp.]